MGPKEKKSFDEGREAGQKWYEWAKEHPFSNGLDPMAPSKPHRDDDDAFNDGVGKGIDDEKK